LVCKIQAGVGFQERLMVPSGLRLCGALERGNCGVGSQALWILEECIGTWKVLHV
jgi:hypothetical protein